jgi:hypothetical protein
MVTGQSIPATTRGNRHLRALNTVFFRQPAVFPGNTPPCPITTPRCQTCLYLLRSPRHALLSFSLRPWHLGGWLSSTRHTNAKTTTRQFSRLFSPILCHIGGASPASRRFLRHKNVNPAPCSRLPAVTSAAIFSTFIKVNEFCNLS